MPTQLTEYRLVIPDSKGNTSGELDHRKRQGHPVDAYTWLENKLCKLAGGYTVSGPVFGRWLDDESGNYVPDTSAVYVFAISTQDPEGFANACELARDCCQVFAQQCVYLGVGGHAFIIGPEAVQGQE